MLLQVEAAGSRHGLKLMVWQQIPIMSPGCIITCKLFTLYIMSSRSPIRRENSHIRTGNVYLKLGIFFQKDQTFSIISQEVTPSPWTDNRYIVP